VTKAAKIRISALLAILVVVVLYALANVRSRRARTEWTRPLNVALVLVRDGAVDPAAIAALKARVATLQDRMADELHRYRAAPDRPFLFVAQGPVDLPAPAPKLEGDGVTDLLAHSWKLSRWVAKIDDAAHMRASAYDTAVYVVLRPAVGTSRFVEGDSEQGGRIGTLEVELDASMVDFALFVTAHELLHTLGALDKYDETGRTKIPEGLADPDAPYPQSFAEVMARGRVIAPGHEEPPDSLELLRVNAATAKEIGWVR
jgi:hypothetical protein